MLLIACQRRMKPQFLPYIAGNYYFFLKNGHSFLLIDEKWCSFLLRTCFRNLYRLVPLC